MKLMAVTPRLRVEVEDDTLMVTLPGTTFHVIYRKTTDTPGLVQFAVQADRSAGISEADFLARARRVANDKARELGWMSPPKGKPKQKRPQGSRGS